jgi:hypothetical protein
LHQRPLPLPIGNPSAWRQLKPRVATCRMFYYRCCAAHSVRCLPQRHPAECSRLEHAPRVNQTPPRWLPTAAIVFEGDGRPRVANVVGVITKRAIADAVIDDYGG